MRSPLAVRRRGTPARSACSFRCSEANLEILRALVAVTDRGSLSVPGWAPSFDCTGLARRVLPLVHGAQLRAEGRVLDLRGALATGFAYESASELVVAKSPSHAGKGAFDTVCSFGALSAAVDPSAVLKSVRADLDKEGRFLFVELDGGAARWRRLLDGPVRLIWGVSASRDISGAIWKAGFELLHLDRGTVYLLNFVPVEVVSGIARSA